jgi:hypothetical protein
VGPTASLVTLKKGFLAPLRVETRYHVHLTCTPFSTQNTLPSTWGCIIVIMHHFHGFFIKSPNAEILREITVQFPDKNKTLLSTYFEQGIAGVHVSFYIAHFYTWRYSDRYVFCKNTYPYNSRVMTVQNHFQ